MAYRTNRVVVDATRSPYARLRPLSLSDVRMDEGGFWFPWRTESLRTALLHGFDQIEKSHTVANFRIAAGQESGSFGGTWFADSDLYKWLEGASFYLSLAPDDGEVRSILEGCVELVHRAQRPDGYLNTHFQLTGIEKRWTNMVAGHELYCAGHLFQAATAHHRVTGSTALLDVAVRFADHIDTVFGPDKRQEPGGHPEVEMGLIELYRSTGTPRYLDLARFFIDQRGKGHLGGEAHHQDHVPVRNATRVAGHAVRQLYLLSGVTDLYLETGEDALIHVLDRLWNDMVTKRIHVTGGVGATPKIRIAGGVDNPYYRGEAFGDDYDLPNFNVHNETCAQIGSAMWNWRMLLATGEAKYADLLEWTLYNSVLSGISVSGDRFFYTNALASRGDIERKPWFPVACCPPNIMRTLASIGNYVATGADGAIQIHLYDTSTIQSNVAGAGSVSARVQTDYPWSGDVKISIQKAPENEFTFSLRIPGWCTDASATVNAKGVDEEPQPGSYLQLTRRWSAGDVIELHFSMDAVFMGAHPYVESARHATTITRGPLVYCFEDVDVPDHGSVHRVEIDTSVEPECTWRRDLFRGAVLVSAAGRVSEDSGQDGSIYRRILPGERTYRSTKLSAIPYFAWANRQKSAMAVWMSRAT